MSNKYGARTAVEDGYVFASHAELRRYRELRLLEAGGVITKLQVHPQWVFAHDGVRIGRYTADFRYYDEVAEKFITEDVKGGRVTATEAYRLRKKLMKAFHGIDVVEVEA